MKTTISIILVLLIGGTSLAQSIQFFYDDAGNRYYRLIQPPIKQTSIVNAIDLLQNNYEEFEKSQEEKEGEITIMAWPNPVNHQINIELNTVTPGDPVIVKVLDGKGVMIKSETFYGCSKKINLSELAPGLYILSVKHGNILENLRIIKN